MKIRREVKVFYAGEKEQAQAYEKPEALTQRSVTSARWVEWGIDQPWSDRDGEAYHREQNVKDLVCHTRDFGCNWDVKGYALCTVFPLELE